MMTRQERLSEIGKLKPSTFVWDGEEIAKNQMSYFIIPFAHEIYEKKAPKKIMKSLESLKWKSLNNLVDDKGEKVRAFSQSDPRFMNSIKEYLYDEMIPSYEDVNEHFLLQKNLVFENISIKKEWTFSSYFRGELAFEIDFLLEGIDLFLVDQHLAFFTLKTKLPLSDNSNINDISSKFNRNIRDFRAIYVDEETSTFSNEKKGSGVKLFEWLSSLVAVEGMSLLSRSESKLPKLQEKKEFSSIFNASYNAKMITAIHVNEMSVKGEEIEPAFTDDLMTRNIDGTSSLEEMPYLLGTTSEVYPTKAWESNEEYISEQVSNGQINIWKYWSGLALYDSLAFFSIGDGGSAIVNNARNSYYFIYMLNLYATYKVRYFEHELIDNEFVSIENIRPLFSDLQRLKNQYMCMELSSLFQPNVVHEAIKGAMKTDDMYEEVKDNIEATLEITARNTDIIVTVLISIFSVGGMYFNQALLMDFFNKHQGWAIGIAAVVGIVIIVGVQKRSTIIRSIKKLRTKISILERMLD